MNIDEYDKRSNIEFIIIMVLFAGIMIFSLWMFVSHEEEYASTREQYLGPKLSEVTCDNLEHYYDMCSGLRFTWQISSCRERYTPKLMQCYGAGNPLI
ncbi:MAG: hypothetical protein ACJAS1_005638 [Oleiphilaceae bacterium]|jgi:hypothetical protein